MKKPSRCWHSLKEQSARMEVEERLSALKTSIKWIEGALNALTIGDPGSPLIERLMAVIDDSELGLPSREATIMALVSIMEVDHPYTVPSQVASIQSVSVLEQFWLALQRGFVSTKHAKAICRSIVQQKHVVKVSVFGSFARDQAKPNDIDILVFDDGTYSKVLEDSIASGTFSLKERVELAISLLGIDSNQNRELISCGWVDILLYNGTLIGADYNYNNLIMSKHADPYFFLNIASDVLDYDFEKDDFIQTEIDLFRYLVEIMNALKEIGFEGRRTQGQDYYI